jgi:hypothetical protein
VVHALTTTDTVTVNKLQRLSNVVSSVPLRNVLRELSPLVPLVADSANIPGGGWAIRLVTQGHTYQVRHQFGNVGNLIHELTHIAVNEAYGMDFVNFHIDNLPVDLPAYGGAMPDGYSTIEAARQTWLKRATSAQSLRNETKCAELIAWAQASELKTEAKTKIVSQLTYGSRAPHLEHDTVMNQVLFWLFDMGYPVRGFSKKPIGNALFEEVEKEVDRCYRLRQAG